jgi:phage gp36-like protein
MAVATPYCDLDDMQRLFSAHGVTAFSDHDGDGQDDSGVTDDCIDEATEEINLFCKLYSTAGLAASTLINRWATTLACFFLCQRRGNPVPESLAAAAQTVRERLAFVLTGALTLNVVKSVNTSPSFSNMEVDRRFPYSRVRVQQQSSDRIPTTLTQKLAGEVPTRD